MRDRQAGSVRVACVHGAGGGGWEWGIWARVFGAHGLGVLAPDLVAGEAGLAATRFADYRAQVVAWCRAAPHGAILVGASLGGLLALAAAEEAGPAALVLVNPLPPSAGAAAVQAPRAGVVPWGSARSLTGTRRAMPDADDAACAYAFRRWRDESAAVLDDAQAGIDIAAPGCPVLVLASENDGDVAPAASRALANRLAGDFASIAHASHVGPLLGRQAAHCAERVCDWLCTRAAARDLTGP
jgi:pimeloyl-ACP methyl ester carboxylesterase